MWLNGYVNGHVDGWLGPLTVTPPPDLLMDTPLERWVYTPALVTEFSIASLTTEFNVEELQTELFVHEDARMIKFPYKDPDEKQDYKLHWTNRLTPLADTVATSTWSIVTDMTGDVAPLEIVTSDIYNVNLSTRVWLRAGTIGNTYQLLNHIVTVGGRILEQTCSIKIKTR